MGFFTKTQPKTQSDKNIDDLVDSLVPPKSMTEDSLTPPKPREVEKPRVEQPKKPAPATSQQSAGNNGKDDAVNMSALRLEFFGPLEPLVRDKKITDIDFNGRVVWTTDENGARVLQDLDLDRTFVKQFCQRVANAMGKDFNKVTPVLEADARTADDISVRISIVHESILKNTWRSICIRKTPPYSRIKMDEALKTGYITPEMMAFLINAIRAKLNIMVCGEPGSGKTELCKFLSQFIPNKDRVVTIEDSLEWHYPDLKPEADSLEMQVNQNLDYSGAIKACLRQNPKWMMISEVREKEVVEFIKGLATGVNGLTTVHCDDVRKIPRRLTTMAPLEKQASIKSDIYSFLNVGVLISRLPQATGNDRRFVDQIGIFYTQMKKGEVIMEDKYLFTDQDISPSAGIIPESIGYRFNKYGIKRPYYDDNVMHLADSLGIEYEDVEVSIMEDEFTNRASLTNSPQSQSYLKEAQKEARKRESEEVA